MLFHLLNLLSTVFVIFILLYFPSAAVIYICNLIALLTMRNKKETERNMNGEYEET